MRSKKGFYFYFDLLLRNTFCGRLLCGFLMPIGTLVFSVVILLVPQYNTISKTTMKQEVSKKASTDKVWFQLVRTETEEKEETSREALTPDWFFISNTYTFTVICFYHKLLNSFSQEISTLYRPQKIFLTLCNLRN